jgi:hypothetical protein
MVFQLPLLLDLQGLALLLLVLQTLPLVLQRLVQVLAPMLALLCWPKYASAATAVSQYAEVSRREGMWLNA